MSTRQTSLLAAVFALFDGRTADMRSGLLASNAPAMARRPAASPVVPRARVATRRDAIIGKAPRSNSEWSDTQPWCHP